MRLWRVVLRVFGRCPHNAMIRVRKPDGSYHVTCDDCGHTEPLIERTKAEIRQFKKAQPSPMRAQRQSVPGQVVTMPRKGSR